MQGQKRVSASGGQKDSLLTPSASPPSAAPSRLKYEVEALLPRMGIPADEAYNAGRFSEGQRSYLEFKSICPAPGRSTIPTAAFIC